MRSGRRERFIQQDKWMPQQSRNSMSSREQPCGTRLRQCRRVARQRWPIFVALISVVGAALAPRLGVGRARLTARVISSSTSVLVVVSEPPRQLAAPRSLLLGANGEPLTPRWSISTRASPIFRGLVNRRSVLEWRWHVVRSAVNA